MWVHSLHVYPLKGARGISLEHAEVLLSGIRHDRRFMALDEHGVFVTQRSHPRMALVDVAIEKGQLQLSALGHTAAVPLTPDGPRRRARVWKDDVEAIEVDGEAAQLLSDHLETKCSLVFMPLDVVRQVDEQYGRPGDRVGFADAFPFLVASLASLAELGARLERSGMPPVPMDRFRPNIVVEGGAPYEEDEAVTARIGPVIFRMPKPCARCQVTLVDQQTGEQTKEPLRTLSTYRKVASAVNFAMNAIPDLDAEESAVIRVRDPVVYGRR
ncbi:MAG TPA: MOSC N-terminal beta barrel domain-containing protein [Labilithrix sp.]|nr:MOSC N-terminal beta barrel domain-containing protein [Labilithrix sp.]